MNKYVNVFEIVNTISNEKCPYIEDFIEALSKVNWEYYSYTTLDKVTKYPERVFAYELYHQLRKIMEKNSQKYDNVYLNGEQTKGKLIVEDLELCTPDLVMHRNMIDCKQEDQLWLCEIKMKGNKEAMSDLNKFHKMSSLNFQCYIFLYAGVKFSEMVDQIGKVNHFEEFAKCEVFKKAICISAYNDEGVKQIHCHSLEEILLNKQKEK